MTNRAEIVVFNVSTVPAGEIWINEQQTFEDLIFLGEEKLLNENKDLKTKLAETEYENRIMRATLREFKHNHRFQ